MKRAVFLDRDGVLNRAVIRDGIPHPPASVAELDIPPEVPQALQELKAAGFLLLVVTNQPDVARGTRRRSDVDNIHRTLAAALPIDDFFTCYHDDADACPCRKPHPGLLFEAAARHDVDLPASYMIGDRWRDVDAGVRAGCQAILIESGYRERAPERNPNARVTSLREAVQWILEDSHPLIP